MDDYKKLEQFAKQVQRLAKEAGFSQFVLMAHDCQSDQVFVARSEQMCAFTQTVYNCVEALNKSAGGQNILSNQSNN